jgi:hypothetical protein
VLEITRPVAAGGDPVRAVLRAVTVYSQPEHAVLKASLLSQLPALGLFALYFVIARFAIVPIASREVDALMPRATVPPRSSATG